MSVTKLLSALFLLAISPRQIHSEGNCGDCRLLLLEPFIVDVFSSIKRQNRLRMAKVTALQKFSSHFGRVDISCKSVFNQLILARVRPVWYVE